MAKHTQGLWELDTSEKYYRPCIRMNGVVICTLTREQTGGDETERKANATLLVSAPDLLAACKQAEAQKGDWLATLQAAIRKAEGESN